MFGLRYFAKAYFAGRYFPPAETAAPVGVSGYFAPNYFTKRYLAGRYFNPNASGSITPTVEVVHIVGYLKNHGTLMGRC